MSRLRDKMQGDLKMHGLCENTRKTYIRCAARFSQHFGKSPSNPHPEAFACPSLTHRIPQKS